MKKNYTEVLFLCFPSGSFSNTQQKIPWKQLLHSTSLFFQKEFD